MICAHCGHNMLDGFKFCHRCGRPISSVTAAPELVTAKTPVQADPAVKTDLPEKTEENSGEKIIAEEAVLSGLPAGRVYLLELLCYIPVFNLILMAVMAASSKPSPQREFARGKLLALTTFTFLLLLTVLIVILLIALDVIDPIYLGRWHR